MIHVGIVNRRNINYTLKGLQIKVKNVCRHWTSVCLILPITIHISPTVRYVPGGVKFWMHLKQWQLEAFQTHLTLKVTRSGSMLKHNSFRKGSFIQLRWRGHLKQVLLNIWKSYIVPVFQHDLCLALFES